MNIIELHYKPEITNAYRLIGRIIEIPEGGCSFYTEVKGGTNESPNGAPSRVYYCVNTHYVSKKDPTIMITGTVGGIKTRQHPILCLVKYNGYWYIAIVPDYLNQLDLCDVNYTTGPNAGEAYPFIDWFNDAINIPESELNEETNTLYSNLTVLEKSNYKMVRYPYLPALGTIQISPTNNNQKDYLYIAVSIPTNITYYMKMVIDVLPFTSAIENVFETYTILSGKDSNGERKTNIIRDTIGEDAATSSSGIIFVTYGDYIFIRIKSQHCYSINLTSTNNNCIMRLMNIKQVTSFANNTLSENDTLYTTSNVFPNTLNPAGMKTLMYNTPRLIKQYGETTERNALLNKFNNNNNTGYISYVRGFRYYDTTLNKPLYLTSTQDNGAGGWYWVDANGNNPDIPTKGTTEQRPTTNIAEGFEYYNTTVHKKQIYNGSTWLDVEDIADTDSKVNNLIPDIVMGNALSTTLAATINKYYRFDTAVDELTVTLPELVSSSKVQNVVVYLTAGSNADSTTITFAAATPTEGTAAPIYYQKSYDIEAGKTYEINALYNGAAWIIAAVEIVTAAPQSSNASNNSLLMGGFTPLDTNSGNAETPDVEPENTETV